MALAMLLDAFADLGARYPHWPYWFFGGGLLWALISYFVGNTKGQGCQGCLLGALLGPFGLLITALLGRRGGA